MKADPTYGVKPPIRKEKARERVLSPDEIRTLWVTLDQAPIAQRTTKGIPRGERATGPTDLPMTRAIALAMKLSLITGQRIGEVTRIELPELTLTGDAPIWVLPASRSKNGESNRVPLSPIALVVIAEARDIAGVSPWLFPAPGGRASIKAHAPTHALCRARATIGIGDFHVHDLRRTAATGMAQLGINPHTIELVLNHPGARRGTVTGKHYVQYTYDKEKREALERWGERLEEILNEDVVNCSLASARPVTA